MKTLSKLQQLSFIIQREFLAISTSYAVLLVLIGGIFVYGLLYNYMYAPNIVTDVPIAIVDNSHSELSRNFIRWLDATPQADVYSQAMDYNEAKEWMKRGKVQGILYLPHDFETRVFRGDESIFSLYATTDAFLYFEALQGASSRVMLAINDKYRPDEAVFLPPQGLLAVTMAKPINVEGTALYNYTEGYGSYLIPALFFVNEITSFLKASRIEVAGTPVTMRILNENSKTKPLSDRSMLFRYSSDRLSDIIRIVNHNSNNLYAEALLRWIALSRYPEASASKGVEILKHFWKEKGVVLDDLVMYDGSGLSPVNRISAEMLCRILDFMASDKNLQTIFYSSLPCPGVSGTVRSFLKNSSLSKRMRLKSGSMAHVQSYAGYYDSGNKRYAVAIIVNNFSGSRSYLRRVLEQMFEDELKSL